MSHSVEMEGSATTFQLWSERASSFPGFISKGFALLDDRNKSGRGWVTFASKNQAMLFKLSMPDL